MSSSRGQSSAPPPRKKITAAWRRESHVYFRNLRKDDESVVGVSLSGGGIRSAMFCSGVLETLLEKDVRIDFLSSVSGGGYVAGSYMDWKYRENGVDHPEWHKRYFENMLRCSVRAISRMEDNFWLGLRDFAYFIFAAIWCVGICSILTSLSLFFLVVCLFNEAFGGFLRSLFEGRNDAYIGSYLPLMLVIGSLTVVLAAFTFSMQNSDRPTILKHGVSSLLTVFLLLVIPMEMCIVKHEIRLLSRKILEVCDYSQSQEVQCQHHCSLLEWEVWLFCHIAWFCAIYLMRYFYQGVKQASMLVVYFFAISSLIEWEVFAPAEEKQSIFRSLFPVLTVFNPILVNYHQSFMFLFYKGFIRSSFFHPRGCLDTTLLQRFRPHAEGFTGSEKERKKLSRKVCVLQDKTKSKDNEELKFNDLCGLSPEWISQVTINRWRYSKDDPRDLDFKLLCISCNVVDIIDHDDEDHTKYFDFEPGNVCLSTICEVSGAAISVFTGLYNSITAHLRGFFMLVGFRFGSRIPAWFTSGDLITKIALPFSVSIILHSFLLLLYLERTSQLFNASLFVAVLTGYMMLALYPPIADGQTFTAFLSRALVSNCLLSLNLRELINGATVGPAPDFVLNVTDGGHTENLGMLSLLRRRATKIVTVDGSSYAYDDNSSELQLVLSLARSWLGCRFTTMDGADIDTDMFFKLGYTTAGVCQQTYQFKVTYTETDNSGSVYEVGTGEILVLQPRHPSKYKPGYWSAPVDESWTSEKCFTFNGIFSSSWNNRLPSLFHRLHGQFPYYSTFWLGYTPEMSQGLMDEGTRASNSPAAQRFFDSLPRRKETKVSKLAVPRASIGKILSEVE